jgi:NAD(P)-dependent dehydrogenase (short-subunit alcohol dehydrogenase family)
MTYANPDLSLEGKRAIVTGASRGIGAAIAERFARNGAKVALVSRRQESLLQVAERLGRLRASSLVLPANMSDPEGVARIVPAVVATWGGVDVLVNNAATNPVFGPLVDLDPSAWDKVMNTNLKGPYLLSVAVAREMVKQSSGVIINIASTGGLEPSPMLGAYSVSKAALIMLTKALAAELGPQGIRVNCIAPGLVETQFAKILVSTPAIHEAYTRRAALRRHGQPEEIAGAAHFLASDASAYMTGQVMVLDGGSRL